MAKQYDRQEVLSVATQIYTSTDGDYRSFDTSVLAAMKLIDEVDRGLALTDLPPPTPAPGKGSPVP